MLFLSYFLFQSYLFLSFKNPEKVTAHTLHDSKNTVIVIKFPSEENLPFSLS